ncbi:MAG: hypothetical protein AMXMBFR64_01760 [Myxococcales bacterium]
MTPRQYQAIVPLALIAAACAGNGAPPPSPPSMPPSQAPVTPAAPPTETAPAPSGAPVEPAPQVSGDPALPGVRAVDAALSAARGAALAAKGPGYRPRTRHVAADGRPTYTNRLILETSPYLLQHAHSPVSWYPWEDEAFERARREDKPLLLSVGYSTCHWCHAMERESLEDPEIAAFPNETFVAIKVDREERPDVDSLYMTAVHLLAGRGGWPMTVVLTPSREPFFAGTYFPARDGDRGARKGFLSILRELHVAYRERRGELVTTAAEFTRRLRAATEPERPADLPGADAIARAAANLARAYDPA